MKLPDDTFWSVMELFDPDGATAAIRIKACVDALSQYPLEEITSFSEIMQGVLRSASNRARFFELTQRRRRTRTFDARGAMAATGLIVRGRAAYQEAMAGPRFHGHGNTSPEILEIAMLAYERARHREIPLQ